MSPDDREPLRQPSWSRGKPEREIREQLRPGRPWVHRGDGGGTLESNDGRRRQWYASSIVGGFSQTEQRLRETWGPEGAYVWRLLLDAAAREEERGTFSYRSDLEAWAKLGVMANAFTPDEFFALTGRMRQTRKTLRNRTTIISVTHWEDWQFDSRRERERNEKPSKRGKSTTGKQRTYAANAPPYSTGTDTGTDKPTAVVEGSEREPVDLKVIHDKGFHVERLIEAIGSDADERTPVQVRSFVAKLPASVFERIREQILEGVPRHKGKFAHAELKREVADRSAA